MRRSQVECRPDIDTFTPGLLALYESLKPSEEHKSKQQQLVDSLAKSVNKEWPNAQLHLYGSSANSFGTSHSDVDVCLEMEIGTASTVEVLVRLADVLRVDNFDNVEVSLCCVLLLNYAAFSSNLLALLCTLLCNSVLVFNLYCTCH